MFYVHLKISKKSNLKINPAMKNSKILSKCSFFKFIFFKFHRGKKQEILANSHSFHGPQLEKLIRELLRYIFHYGKKKKAC